MSTRCNIIVKAKGKKITLYHHWDGYPEGVGQDLVNKLQKVFDNDYFCLWTHIVNKLVKDREDEGYEITTGLHGDIEYLYTIDTDKKTLKFQSVGYEKDGDEWKQTFSKKYDVVKELEKLHKEKEKKNADILS